MSWYEGPSLVNAIDACKTEKRSLSYVSHMAFRDVTKTDDGNFKATGYVHRGI